jgi:hypothetical protein
MNASWRTESNGKTPPKQLHQPLQRQDTDFGLASVERTVLAGPAGKECQMLAGPEFPAHC